MSVNAEKVVVNFIDTKRGSRLAVLKIYLIGLPIKLGVINKDRNQHMY
jgi:hypothetical protein